MLEMNYHEDIDRNIDCLTLSIGANSIEQFNWIENNLMEFKNRSIMAYNAVLEKFKELKTSHLYLVVREEKANGFSLMEQHLGVFHQFGRLIKTTKEKDIYLDKTIRINFVEWDSLDTLKIPLIAETVLIMSKEKDIKVLIQELDSQKELFDFFYDKGSMIIEVNDFFSEGNSLTIFSKFKTDMEQFIACAKAEGFKDI